MKNKGTTLCIISLICMFVAPLLIFIIGASFMSGDISGATADAYGMITLLDIAAYIAAWVLAIVSRAKFKNRFSLVLLIVYILAIKPYIFSRRSKLRYNSQPIP